MNELSMCRICLDSDLSRHSILHTPLQEVYQSLTGIHLESDQRPLEVCYICRGRLLTCYRLKMNCLHSEELFNQMMTSPLLTSVPLKSIPRMRLARHSAIVLSNIPGPQTLKYNVRKEPPQIWHKVEIKKENTDKADNEILDDTEGYSIPSDEFNIVKIESQEHKLEHCTNSSSKELSVCANKDYYKDGVQSERRKKIRQKPVIKEELIEVSRNLSDEHTLKNKLPFMCDVCNRCFTDKAHLTQHVCIHKGRRKGAVCTESFSNNCIHITTDKNLYQCDVCKKTFSHSFTLQKHSRVHTNEKPYQCTLCGKVFYYSLNELEAHMRTHTGEKPFKCDVCNKCFSINRNLKRHLLVHTGQKPYQCDVCKKSFGAKFSLVVHLRRHTGEKPYKCDTCHSSFIVHSDLCAHLLKHNVGKKFICDFCKKGFSSRSILNRHISTHSSEKPHQCDVCKKGFSRKNDLLIHSRRIHTRRS